MKALKFLEKLESVQKFIFSIIFGNSSSFQFTVFFRAIVDELIRF